MGTKLPEFSIGRGSGALKGLRAWGQGLNKRGGAGWGMGGGTGATQSVRGNYKFFKGTNLTVGCGRHASVYHVHPVSILSSIFQVRHGEI